LLGPALILLGILSIYPLYNIINLALHRYNLARPWVPRDFLGLGNFIDFFSDDLLGQSLLVTVKFGLATVGIELLVGFAVAWLLSRQLRGSGIFRIIFLIPMMIVPVVGGLTWRLMLNTNYGVVNWLLAHLGMDPQVWLGTDWALFSIITAEVWHSMPFAILIFTVALQQIPRQYYEAAAMDGASPWLTFVKITLPNLRWAILIVAIFKLSDAIKAFDIIFTLTGGGPGITTQTLAVYIQRTAFTHSELGYAAALSFLMLVISFVLMYPLIKRLRING
jgi:multiple sugar transport system permease protein